MGAQAAPELSQRAKEQFVDCSRVVIFDDKLQTLYSTYEAPQAELKALTQTFGDRNASISNGLVLQDKRFEVHRHHPPLVYGRSMTAEPEQSEGAAVCRVNSGPGGLPAYAAITYQMPHVSARMVQLLKEFCEKELASTA